MEDAKLEALLRGMLVDLQHLSNKADKLRSEGEQIGIQGKQIDQRVMDLQHAIARLAHHSGVNPFDGGRGARQSAQRRTRSRSR